MAKADFLKEKAEGFLADANGRELDIGHPAFVFGYVRRIFLFWNLWYYQNSYAKTNFAKNKKNPGKFSGDFMVSQC